MHSSTHRYTYCIFNHTKELSGKVQPCHIGASLCKMSAIAREACLISPHSVHTWSQSGVDQTESIMELYEAVTLTTHLTQPRTGMSEN